ncbi:MAG: hypothetical protein CVU71_00270 [Deltaproteobacteria bacterium HGW-Deltaproteobacteria-6]|jgi:PAS domain S-box-containing protein|nr:MAG: hypothetical protein CVU71_00270 [Deltaproteobacteria bacterium HGW-Deltaproteobacteria-6]
MHDLSKACQDLVEENAILQKKISELEQSDIKYQQAQEALRKRDIDFTKLSSWVPGMIYQFTRRPDGTYFVPFTTDAIREIFGCSPQDVREDLSPITGAILPEDLDKVMASIERSARDLTIWTCEYRVQLPGQSVRWISGTSTPEKMTDGSVTWYGFNTDVTERKRAEEMMRESEDKFKYVFDNSVVGKSITFPDGRVNVNKAFSEMVGYSQREINERGWRAITHPDDIAQTQAEMDSIVSGQKDSARFIKRFIHKNGSVVWTDIASTLRRDKEGNPLYFITTLVDITERKQVLEALRISVEQYSKIFNLSPINISLSTLADGRYVEANDLWFRTTEYTREEVIGRTATELGIWANPEDRQRMAKTIMDGGVIRNQEYYFRSKSGRMYLLSFTAAVIEISGIPHIISLALDITDQKRAEDALRQSEEKYRTIIEQMEDGYFEIDLAGNFTFVNDAENKILGYSGDELIGTNNRQYQDKASAQRTYQLFRNVYRTGEPIKALDIEIIRKNGMKGFHEVSVSLMRNAEGNPVGFRGLTRDITERRQAEEEKRRLEERLQRAEKMEALGQLAGGVAHDLNNVLGILSGYSELLLMEIPEGHRGRRHVEKIMQSTEKGAAIIQDLLTLARRGVTSSDVINLNSITGDFLKTPVFENIRSYHPRVNFKTDCQTDLLNIKGSPVHLEKTLMNLVSNAAESISGPGEVAIRTENRYLDKAVMGYDEVKEGDYAVLIVSDTGMGIPAEHIEKIFEPFYTKKIMGRSGTGLGLAIVWGTVKDHNGYIDVQTRVGEGTTFTLYFPVTREEPATPQQKLPVERYMGKGESILVVDDIAEQREVASGLLKKLGYDVHAVSGGEEAVEYLKSRKADILVLDMIMAPGIDGLETYQRVLEVNPQQKAVLVSGFSETVRVRKAQQLGAGAYVKKPYVMEKIGVAIRDELDR